MFTYQPTLADSQSARFWESGPKMGAGEYFAREFSHAWRTSTLGLLATELDIQAAERKAGEWAPTDGLEYPELVAADGYSPPDEGAGGVEGYATGVKGMDEGYGADGQAAAGASVRARKIAEYRAERDAEAAALAAGRPDGAGKTALSLGAALLAGMADPINFLPFGAGALAKAGGWAKAAWAGAKAGAAGSVAADAVIIPWANAYGEELGWKEAATDAVFGAALGAGFGVGGPRLRPLYGTPGGRSGRGICRLYGDPGRLLRS